MKTRGPQALPHENRVYADHRLCHMKTGERVYSDECDIRAAALRCAVAPAGATRVTMDATCTTPSHSSRCGARPGVPGNHVATGPVALGSESHVMPDHPCSSGRGTPRTMHSKRLREGRAVYLVLSPSAIILRNMNAWEPNTRKLNAMPVEVNTWRVCVQGSRSISSDLRDRGAWTLGGHQQVPSSRLGEQPQKL